jgi:hypothetical protein
MSYREGHLFTSQNQEKYSHIQQENDSDFQHQHIHINYPELSMDDLKVYSTQLLPINEHNAIDLPNDYLDYVTVGIPFGEGVRPLVEDTKLNVLNKWLLT